jgi:DGQHR domain-containing protein
VAKIPLSVNEFLAIRVDQPFGSFYSVRLNSKFILQRAYSKSASFDGSEITGAQRKLSRDRLKEIGEFIDSDDAMFPSSIIIAANYYEDDRFAEEDDQWRVEAVDEGLNLYKLIVPSDKIVCSIVDGQLKWTPKFGQVPKL